jgi:hypothetical protein
MPNEHRWTKQEQPEQDYETYGDLVCRVLPSRPGSGFYVYHPTEQEVHRVFPSRGLFPKCIGYGATRTEAVVQAGKYLGYVLAEEG